MKAMFSRLNINDPKSFIETRDLIGKIFYVIFMFIYAGMWIVNKPSDVPVFSFYLTMLMTPLLLFSLHLRAFHYLFIYNWFYILYYLGTGLIFFLAMSHFNPDYNKNYFLFEFSHLVIANVIGVLVTVGMSLPFKLVHWLIFDAKDIYYNWNVLELIDERIYPEKKKEKVNKQKEKFHYDQLNETQLQVALKNAVDEDRFEDAEKIRKILDSKFR